MKTDFVIADELKKLPDKPGVYLMHGASDEILYVGKAVVLKKRVRQYFQSPRGKSVKIRRMIEQIAWFEYIVTDSEREALVLECNLIKEHRPKYNTMLVDDKGYPFIRVTTEEAFPRVFKTRHSEKGKSRYFGPYTSAFAVKNTLELLRKVSLLRTCNRKLPEEAGKKRPCLNYDLGLCLGPCRGTVSEAEYAKRVEPVLRFLSGDDKEIVAGLKEKMQSAANENDFETAILYRDLINEVKQVSGRQKITDMNSDDDRDFIAVAKDESHAFVTVFFVRNGALLGRETLPLSLGASETVSDVLSDFVKQYYAEAPMIPKEIYVAEDFSDREITESVFSQRVGHKVAFLVPKRGEKEHFLTMAEENARLALQQGKERILREKRRTEDAASALASLLSLPSVSRIEAFDISNISGYESVGSMVVFIDGRPKKNDYRKFRIESVSGPNDYASMEEVLSRRFLHFLERKTEDTSFGTLPDLILMDGGRGQVHIAETVLSRLGISVPVAGMVKDDRHRTRDIYFRDRLLHLDSHSEAFHLTTRIQDEAHRFAITYHRGLHEKKAIQSVLSKIPGVGPKRETALIHAFRDIDALKAASVSEIAAVEGFHQTAAEAVYAFLHNGETV